MTTHDPIPARLAALKVASTTDLKQQWRDLFDTEPPPFNRRFLESRLAYRIQELAYGGLKPETIRRLEQLGEQLDGGNVATRRTRTNLMPMVGTRLIREYQGVEQVVTVLQDGFEWQGRPYQSLSSVARAITGTRWNGWTFFGLKNHRGAA
jgi:transposase